MSIVKTGAPIALEDLKKFFADNETFFEIDYSNSSLKGQKLLTYLGNLDIPSDITLKGMEKHELDELLEVYLHSTTIVNIASLEELVTHILIDYKMNGAQTEFSKHNEDIIRKWISRLDSLTLFNMYMVNVESFKQFVQEFPEDDTTDLTGVNFVSLLKNEEFYRFYGDVDRSALRNYTRYFNDYMFKGKNLFSYWANENNPLFLLMYGLTHEQELQKNDTSV